MKYNSILAGAIDGCRRSRYGDFVILTMQLGAFAVTAQDMQQAETWARARPSSGNAGRDRTAFTARFENLLARSGGGVATRGNKPALKRIVDGMIQNGIDLAEWMLPPNLNESVEIRKKKPAAPDAPPSPESPS